MSILVHEDPIKGHARFKSTQMQNSIVALGVVASTEIPIIKQFLSDHSEGCVDTFSAINLFSVVSNASVELTVAR